MYVVIKIIKGRRYRYLQWSWREGKRVRTKSVYLGTLDGGGRGSPRGSGRRRLARLFGVQRMSPEDHAMAALEREARKFDELQRERFGETGAERIARERREHFAKLHSAYGLKLSNTKPESTPAEVDVAEAGEDSSSKK